MKYVALLRGINVGGNNKVPMGELKTLFQDLGFTNVRTCINSGNVVCDGNQTLIQKVEPSFEKRFGFPIRFLFLTQSRFKKIHDAIPEGWTNDTHNKTDVWFLWKEYDRVSSLKLLTVRAGVDEVQHVTGAIIWHVPKKLFGKSGMNEVIKTDLYRHLTARNVNTVRKLYQLLNE